MSSFGSDSGSIEMPQKGLSERPCRRNPEEELQQLSALREGYVRQLSRLDAMSGDPLPHECYRLGEAMRMMVGNLQISIWDLNRKIDALLEEINKE